MSCPLLLWNARGPERAELSALRTKKLYVDQVFVCKTTCIVKDLSVVTAAKRTDKKTCYSRCEDRLSVGDILIYNFGHPGQYTEVDHCPSYLTRPSVIITVTLKANQLVKKVPKDWTPTKPPTHVHPLLRLLCKTQGRDKGAHPPAQTNLTNTESYECLKLIFSCQSHESGWLDFSIQR